MASAELTVLTLGGTIAMTDGAEGGVVPNLSGDDLVAAVPELSDVARINVTSFRQLPSAHLGFDDIEALADIIRGLPAQGQDGVVVTQGTDTIEETAFALDRLIDLDIPVVITGAMRNPTIPGSDGPANLLASARVAAGRQARSCGCLVVMNDEIHAARFIRKTHTSNPGAFTSPLCGRIGWISEGNVRICTRPEKMPGVPATSTPENANVAIVAIGLGSNSLQIDALQTKGIDGLVVEATGGGHVAPDVAAALEHAAQRIPVILASRTGTGETLAQTYGYVGGEIDLQRRGLIRAGWLDGLKARILLTLLLRHGQADQDDISEAFKPWGGG